jgi:fused signal recognition particle receptor
MFGKLKQALSKFTKKAEDTVKEKIKKTKAPATKKKIEKPIKQKKPSEKKVEKKEKKGILAGIKEAVTTTKISENKFDELFEDLEIDLLENNVAYDIVEEIKSNLKEALVDTPIERGKVTNKIEAKLKEIVTSALSQKQIDLLELSKTKKIIKILFVGVNGVGKTTSIAKLTKYLQNNKKSIVFAASDTFRAAAIEQLETHANKLKIKVIKHKYGSDAAAVAFDAIKHAESKNINYVMIDTAGRSHANVNLMEELSKVKRIADPDLTILVVDSLTGNDAVEQANFFNEKIGIDGIIISKADADEKGGAIISVAQAIQKPILFLGTGQKYEDLEPFDLKKILKRLGF